MYIEATFRLVGKARPRRQTFVEHGDTQRSIVARALPKPFEDVCSRRASSHYRDVACVHLIHTESERTVVLRVDPT